MKRIDLLLLLVLLAVGGIVYAIQVDSGYYAVNSSAVFQFMPLELFQYLMYLLGIASGGLWAYFRFVSKSKKTNKR